MNKWGYIKESYKNFNQATHLLTFVPTQQLLHPQTFRPMPFPNNLSNKSANTQDKQTACMCYEVKQVKWIPVTVFPQA